MAIGDDLLMGSRGSLLGPVSFTPEMQAQGITLAGTTTPFGTTLPGGPDAARRAGFTPPGRDLFPGIAPGVEDFTSVRNKMRMEPDTMRVQRAKGPLFSPEDLRPSNPFDPSQKVAPEDDALTPPGMLAPSEIKETGGFFAKLGDILANPAAQKFLAAMGMQINPHQTALGEFAMGAAESAAQNQFRQELESGKAAGDILSPGLSAEGRRAVLGDVEAERHREAIRTAEAGQAQRAEERLQLDKTQEERLQAESAARIERLGHENAALAAAAEFSEGRDPNQIVRAGASALGINLPEGIDLSQFTPDQAFQLTQELASIKRIQTQMGGRTSKDGMAELSEAMRETAIKSAGRELAEMRAAYASAPEKGGGGERAQTLARISALNDRILELGGDPTQFTPGASTAAGGGDTGPDPGIQKIMEVTGFDEEKVKAMSPAQKAQWLRAWLTQKG